MPHPSPCKRERSCLRRHLAEPLVVVAAAAPPLAPAPRGGRPRGRGPPLRSPGTTPPGGGAPPPAPPGPPPPGGFWGKAPAGAPAPTPPMTRQAGTAHGNHLLLIG